MNNAVTIDMTGEFESIRPYNDSEVADVIKRLSQDPALLGVIARFRYPRLSKPLGWAIKPLLRTRLRQELACIDSVQALQDKLEPYVDRAITQATEGVTYSGVDRLRADRPYLFLANHRDIVMDPAFVNYALYHAGLPTPRIAIGDNLLQKPFVSDLMRLNKSFIVHRSLTGRRERLEAFQSLSAYINHSLRNDRHSIWIAQAEGRAKDGDDRTDPAILKMLHMSSKEQESFAELTRALHIVPVAISYEFDPCDLAKARELHIRETTGSYSKAAGEDDLSIAMGITGYKGRVHVSFGEELRGDYEDARQLAQAVDQSIITQYRLFPAHYLAWYAWSERDPQLEVPGLASLFPAHELAKAREEWTRRLDDCPAEFRAQLIRQYATPVRNHYVGR